MCRSGPVVPLPPPKMSLLQVPQTPSTSLLGRAPPDEPCRRWCAVGLALAGAACLGAAIGTYAHAPPTPQTSLYTAPLVAPALAPAVGSLHPLSARTAPGAARAHAAASAPHAPQTSRAAAGHAVVVEFDGAGPSGSGGWVVGGLLLAAAAAVLTHVLPRSSPAAPRRLGPVEAYEVCPGGSHGCTPMDHRVAPPQRTPELCGGEGGGWQV